MSAKILRVRVEILPRPEILDTQGRAVKSVLEEGSGANLLREVKVGKLIVLEFSDASPDQALALAKQYAHKVLVNPLIEDFSLRLEN